MRGNKGWAYSIIMFVAFLGIFGLAFFSMQGEFEIKDSEGDVRTLGIYQSALLDSIKEGEEALLYLDQAAKYSLQSALEGFEDGGGDFVEVPDGAESLSSAATSECGKFVYNRWSKDDQFCPPPSGEETYKKFLDSELDSFLSTAPYNFPLDNYEYTISEEENGTFIKGTAKEPLSIDIISTNRYVVQRGYIDFNGTLSWPVRDSVLTSCYGKRNLGDGFHDGIDFGREGDVLAAESGTVIDVCNSQRHNTFESDNEQVCGGLGNYVLIKHDQIHTRYSHMAHGSVNVRPGDRVSKGDKIGEIGNTGYSTGPHLDFKVYTGSDFSSDKGRNPLCFYEAEEIARLSATGNAYSCFDKFGNRPIFREETVKKFCPGRGEQEESFAESLVSSGLYSKKVGSYEVMPNFKVKTDLPLPAGTDPMSEVVDWAESTWQECLEDPGDCITGRMQEYNSQNNSFSLSKLSDDGEFACEDNMFYAKVVDHFETCLNNEQSNCHCDLDVEGFGDGEIFLEGDTLRLTGEERYYEFPTNVSYYSANPADPSDPQERIDIISSDGETKLTTLMTEGKKINELKLYKPEKDKVVVVGDTTGKPSCNTNRRNFLVCAESRETYEFERGGRTVNETRKMRFALELRDKDPSSESIEVETQELEQSNDGLADMAKEQALAQGIGLILGGPLTTLVNSLLPSSKDVGMKVDVKVPESADISGFEVYCNAGTPLGDVSLSSEDPKFVSVDNPYINQTRQDVKRTSNLDFEEPEFDAQADNCEYVKLRSENGVVSFARKLTALDYGDRKSFLLNQCGSDAIEQLSNGVAEYCVTMVPVDENGNRGEPIVKCQKFSSLQDRVFEILGVKEITDSYFKVVEEADAMASALREGNYRNAISLVSPETGEQLDELEKQVSEQLGVDAMRNSMQEISSMREVDFRREMVNALSEDERVAMVRDLVSRRGMPEDMKNEAIHGLNQFMTTEAKRSFLLKTADNLEDITERSEQEFTRSLLGHAETFNEEKDVQILREARSNQRIDSYLANKKEENQNYNAIASDRGLDRRSLNELGLTTTQTSNAVRDIVGGEIGMAGQKALMKEEIKVLSDQQVSSTFELLTTLTNDNRLQQDLFEEVRNLPRNAQDQLYRQLMEESRINDIREAISQSREELRKSAYDYFYDNYENEMLESVKEAREQFFNAKECAENPWDNIRNNFPED